MAHKVVEALDLFQTNVVQLLFSFGNSLRAQMLMLLSNGRGLAFRLDSHVARRVLTDVRRLCPGRHRFGDLVTCRSLERSLDTASELNVFEEVYRSWGRYISIGFVVFEQGSSRPVTPFLEFSFVDLSPLIFDNLLHGLRHVERFLTYDQAEVLISELLKVLLK